MRFVVIDSEAPSVHGGGIRTYTQLTVQLLTQLNIPVHVYTHNAQAYPNTDVTQILRKPFLLWPLASLAYRLFYSENVLFEHANWLMHQLEKKDTPDTIYEFPDFLGYGFFVMKNSRIKKRTNLRIHTPNFMVKELTNSRPKKLSQSIAKFREKFCLKLAYRISVPSAHFINEKLPTLKNWYYLPNPIPNFLIKKQSATKQFRFLYLGRIEERKGIVNLLKAFILFAQKNIHASLTLVGSKQKSKYANEVDEILKGLPNELKTRINSRPACSESERSAILQQFDFLIVPSLWENSPYVYFEGMAAGLICIGSNTGEMKKIAHLTHAPIFSPGNEVNLLEILEQTDSLNREQILESQFQYLHDVQKKLPAQFLEYLQKF